MTSERMRRAYDLIAARFAAANATMPADLARAAARLAELVAPGARVLDLGCGAGRDLAWLERLGLSPVGVDLSGGMLAEARQRTRAPLLQMDMRDLGFADGQFEAIWCCASLLHLSRSEAPAALGEMRRVLAPRGILFLAVQEGAGEGWERAPYGEVDRFFARYSQAEVAGLLAQSGFSVLEWGASRSEGRAWLRAIARRVGCAP